jgi:nucleoside 2-deoxyribosyltransferase
MKNIYLAGPLFTLAEQQFNTNLAVMLQNAGFKVFLPQAECKDLSGVAIFNTCKHGIDTADVVVAILDGADADSGTCWECGYAYALKKPIVAIRTDFRESGDTGGFNAMLYYTASKLFTGNNFINPLVEYLETLE